IGAEIVTLLAIAMLAIVLHGPGDPEVRVMSLPPVTTLPPITAPNTAPITAPPITAPITAPPITAPPITAPITAPTNPDVTIATVGTTTEIGTTEPARERERGTTRAAGSSPGTGTLNVAVTGGWASIFVDGEAAGTTPRRLELPARRHVIELRRDGRLVERRAVTIERGRTERLVVPLE
ncbi:MAG: hypothetical protein K1X94_08690, partial [Sandaracinaceae bacterium]|nr:hypothetical protein [Sandaracinaceae bacterium]